MKNVLSAALHFAVAGDVYKHKKNNRIAAYKIDSLKNIAALHSTLPGSKL